MSRRVIVPLLSRAGLGNELFTFLRAVELLHDVGGVLLPPKWLQPRIGPIIRGERDRRAYWRLFRPAPLQLLLAREVVRWACTVLTPLCAPAGPVVLVKGMGGQFHDLARPGPWHRERLRAYARPGVVSDPLQHPYMSVHVRLGDFGGSDAEQGLDSRLQGPNTSAPLEWYVHWVRRLRLEMPEVPVVLSSDGTTEQLAPLLDLEGVVRSPASNALDEMVLLSHAIGLIGSRSTFSAWGAFLGRVPMLVPLGGNQYEPHFDVWEAGSEGASAFMAAVRERKQS